MKVAPSFKRTGTRATSKGLLMPRCFTCISTALFLTLVNPPLFGQSPLDVPGERKVTVRSEIARGQSEIFEAALNTRFQGGNLWTSMNDLIKRNKSLQKDSEGFLLGAHFEQVRQLDA